MKKYPFTTTGVQEWQSALYAEPDETRQREAGLAGSIFGSWLASRFDLNGEQQEYLAGLDPLLLNVWGTEVAYSIIYRLPIVLIRPDNPPPGNVLGAKLILSEEELASVRDGRAKGTGRNKLTFTISY